MHNRHIVTHTHLVTKQRDEKIISIQVHQQSDLIKKKKVIDFKNKLSLKQRGKAI